AAGCRRPLRRSAGAVPCTRSRAAGCRGSRSISPRTTGAPAARSCRRSPQASPRFTRRRSRRSHQGEPGIMCERFYHLRDRRLALLVIDEAQNLSLPALEEVRMLSNLETEKSKLIQIVMVGQPNLRTILARSELEQLRQRVTVSYHLQPLDAAETGNYINHRL